MRKILALLIGLSLVGGTFVGCASVNSVSLSSIPANKSKEVRAETSKTIILGFNFNNDYVDDMAEDLKRQCPNGVVKGILTKDEVIQYFLFFVWARKVSATGYCLQSRSTASVPSGDME
jgi:hypothetical protein